MPDHLCRGGTRQAPPFVATAALFNLFVPKLFMSLMIQDMMLTCTSETSSYHDIFSLFNLKPIISVVLAKPCMRNPPVIFLFFDANGSVKPSPAYDIPVAVNPYNCKTCLREPSCPSNLFSYYFFRELFFNFVVDWLNDGPFAKCGHDIIQLEPELYLKSKA